MAGKDADVDGLKVIKGNKIVLVSSLHKNRVDSQEIGCDTALWKLQFFKLCQPGPTPKLWRGASGQNYPGLLRVKGVPSELLPSPVTRALVFAAEHCLVRTAITRAWPFQEL